MIRSYFVDSSIVLRRSRIIDVSIDAPRLIREANHDNVFKSSSVINPLTRACLTVILCANEKIRSAAGEREEKFEKTFP